MIEHIEHLDVNGEPVITLEDIGGSPIKISDLWEKVREIALENPDYIYPLNRDLNTGASCSYERGGEPSCLVGQGMARCGVPVRILGLFDRVSDSSFGDLVDIYPDLFEIDEEDLVTSVKLAQAEQDRGRPWGGAIDVG